MQGFGFAIIGTLNQVGRAIAKQTKCWPVGHAQLEQHILSENSGLHYPHAERNAEGKALSWPTCPRCGWQKVDVDAERRRRRRR